LKIERVRQEIPAKYVCGVELQIQPELGGTMNIPIWLILTDRFKVDGSFLCSDVVASQSINFIISSEFHDGGFSFKPI
jgi:hypothetical protein